EYVAAHLLLRQAHLDRQGAIHVHHQLRLVANLVEIAIDDTGHLRDLIAKPLGERVVSRLVRVGTADLDVDGGGQPEVQHLGGNVRRLKVEGALRVGAREGLAQLADVVPRRAVLRRQADVDLAVERGDRAAVAPDDVDPARRAEVVEYQRQLAGRDDLPNGSLDLAEEPRRFLQAG